MRPAGWLERVERWLPDGPVILAPLLLFWDILIGGKALYWGLPTLQFIPWRYFAWETLRSGALPLWNPYNGMGAPLLANYQLAFYYPPGWILYLFTGLGGMPFLAWGCGLLLVLHLIWAGLGTTRVLKDLGQGKLAQAVGGLAFGLCGYLVARNNVFPMIWTAAWLPWLIHYANRIPESGRKFPPLQLIFSLAMLLLAGHAQMAWYTLLFTSGWVMVVGWSAGRWKGLLRGLWFWALAAVVGLVLSSAQLLPTLEYLLQSQRSAAVDYQLGMMYSFWPWRFLTLLAPDMFGNPGYGTYWGYASYWEDAVYVGLLPFVMALMTLRRLSSKTEQIKERERTLLRFLWVTIVVSFVLALGKNMPIFPFLYRYVPTFSMFQAPARFLILVEFSLAILAGVGVEYWRKPAGRSLRWLKRGVVISAAIFLGALAAVVLPGGRVEATFIRATALAGILALLTGVLALRVPPPGEQDRTGRWQAAVILLISVDLLIAGYWLKPVTNLIQYGAKWLDAQPSVAAINPPERLYISAADDYWLKYNRFVRFDDFRPIEDAGNVWKTLLPNTNLAQRVASVNNFDPLLPGRYVRWMSALETRAPAEKETWLRLMGAGWIEQVDAYDPTGVKFSQLAPVIRRYWTVCALPAKDTEDAWQKTMEVLTDLQDRLVPDRVILESDTTKNMECGQITSAQIDLIFESASHQVYQVQADQDGWLVLSDTWYPGWWAAVDGVETAVLKANYLFRAIYVKAGNHQVVLDYRPASVRIGLILSAAAWGLIFLSLLVKAVRNSSGNNYQNK